MTAIPSMPEDGIQVIAYLTDIPADKVRGIVWLAEKHVRELLQTVPKGGYVDSPPPSAEQLRECIYLLRDLADALEWSGNKVAEVRNYSALDRLWPYRSINHPRSPGESP